MEVSEYFFLQITDLYGETGTPAIDTAPPAGLVQDCITLVACPVPSYTKMPVQPLVRLLFVASSSVIFFPPPNIYRLVS